MKASNVLEEFISYSTKYFQKETLHIWANDCEVPEHLQTTNPPLKLHSQTDWDCYLHQTKMASQGGILNLPSNG